MLFSKRSLVMINSVFTILLSALFLATTALAHNKVVVIPLSGDDSPTSKAVFVTQDTHSADFGGPAGADAFCQSQANMAGSRVQGKQFKAWISGGFGYGFEPGDRSFARSSLPYKLVNGVEVASSYEDLVDGGPLQNPIIINQMGLVSSILSYVWTGMDEVGVTSYNNVWSCQGWTVTFPNFAVVAGDQFSSTTWSEEVTAAGRPIQNCGDTNYVYCFEQ